MQLGNAGKIGISWAILTVAGVYAFILAKDSIDKQRLESMKIRERMRKSNYGEYQESDKRFSA